MPLKDLKKEKTLKTVIILVSVAVLYMVYRYQGSAGFFKEHLDSVKFSNNPDALSQYCQWGMALFLLGILPALGVRFGFRERLRDYGLGIEKPLWTFGITLLGMAFVTPFAFFGAKNPQYADYYPLVKSAGASPILFVKSAFFYFLYYAGYEFFFRGFLFMGIKDDVGELQALAVSLAATVLLHVTQPQGEMILSILAGIVFPLIVLRLKSLLPVILIHAFMGISFDYWIIVHSGGF
jgi:membrane protease YdiL (CAAX protease family)